jgi:pimeloyl-ACP methyl ester carboxylesterase
MHDAMGIEYEVRGQGDPVLLIHGSHVADALRPLAHEPALADRFRLIGIHRRGFAGSARHAGPFPIAAQARDALRPIEALGIDRCHVVGHSYGAVAAVQLALDAPGAVRSLVLMEPPLFTADESPAIAAGFAPLVERFRGGDARGAVEAFLGIVGGSDWRHHIESVPGALEQAVRDAATFFDVEVPALAAWSFDAEMGRRISQPVLFLSGSASGPLFERPRELFLASVPRAESRVFEGVGHLFPVHASARVAPVIAEFLARQRS